jgi:hypothetical protein
MFSLKFQRNFTLGKPLETISMVETGPPLRDLLMKSTAMIITASKTTENTETRIAINVFELFLLEPRGNSFPWLEAVVLSPVVPVVPPVVRLSDCVPEVEELVLEPVEAELVDVELVEVPVEVTVLGPVEVAVVELVATEVEAVEEVAELVATEVDEVEAVEAVSDVTELVATEELVVAVEEVEVG